ncbi:MAG TPA: RtcB family protein [Streptosporangiaceae bacterium]|nr:RtcB family protein [Streptosporangiaceae bacterium]
MQEISERLLNWASILDDPTREQAARTATLPFIFPHVALMPDAHLGKGATVGSVIPTLKAVIPAAVGVDIGCGMIAVRTQFTADDVAARGDFAVLRQSIERAIPLSAGKHNRAILNDATRQRISELEELDGADSAQQITPNWRLQIGSLGSGNHFIEVSLDEERRIWAFLHSGSRGVGNKLANKHIKIARDVCSRRRVDLPDRDLAYLSEDTPEFWTYIRDLRWAQRFAFLNREEMMARLLGCLASWLRSDVTPAETVNCHHNYTAEEEHFGKRVWLSRKGAIDASAGRPGLIPGSMGTRSYVVTGKGSALALNSAPHGAGRMFSRTAARKHFSRADLEASMVGIEWRHTDAFLDEIPAAYKDIDQVMADASDLVEIRHTLRQIVNVKGD